MSDIAEPAGGPSSSIDEAKRQKLLELVRGRALARPTDLAEDEVMVWPSLVVVEAVCATVFLLILTMLSIFVGAPLTEMANPNKTPNPSKNASTSKSAGRSKRSPRSGSTCTNRSTA